MGTAQQWLDVAWTGGIWAGFTLLFDLGGIRRAGRYSVAHILAMIPPGFCLGLLGTFGPNAFRAPLIYLVIPALIASVCSVLFYRRAIRNQGNPSPSLD